MKKLYSFKYALLLAYLLINCFVGQATEHSGSLEFSKILTLNLPQQLLKKVGSLSENSRNTSSKIKQSENSGGLVFVKNEGQIIDDQGNKRPEILFSTTNNGVSVFIEKGCLNYVFTKTDKTESEQSIKEKLISHAKPEKQVVTAYRFRVNLVGSNPNAEVIADDKQDYYEMHYTGENPTGLKVESYKKITIKDAYPGVNWLIYSNGEGLKYDFVVNKHENLSKIKLKIEGAESFIDKEGNLIMNTPLGKIIEESPKTYQDGNLLQSNFKLNKGDISFNISGAISNKPIIIDPTIMWSTYYGGNGAEIAPVCATDNQDNFYQSGSTLSTNFPNQVGVTLPIVTGKAYISKFNINLVPSWTVVVGSSFSESVSAITTDRDGNIIITGATTAFNFITQNAAQSTNLGNSSAFVFKVNSTGNLIFSTYLGGGAFDIGLGCTTDNQNNVFIVGRTNSFDFLTQRAFQVANSGGDDGFITKLAPSGNLIWSTYIGGSEKDYVTGCTIDRNSRLVISGLSASSALGIISNFPNTKVAFEDGLLMKFDSSGTPLWGRFIGGNVYEEATSVVVDSTNNIYVAGITNSTIFVIGNAYQSTKNQIYDGFINKFDSLGNSMWGTFFGGRGDDDINQIVIDKQGNLYISGITTSNNFPLIDPVQSTYSNIDVFAARFTGNGFPVWSTYLGGTGQDYGYGCALDSKGGLIITGTTRSNNFPIVNPIQSTKSTAEDGFITRILNCNNFPTPTITKNRPDTICFGDSVSLSAPVGFKYLWSTGDTSRSISVKRAGAFSVRTYRGICTSAVSNIVMVAVNDSTIIPNVQILGDTSLCKGDSVTLIGPPNAIYFWTNNATTRSITVKDSGSFALRISVNGCNTGLSRTIKVNKAPAPPSALIFPSGPTNFCQGDSVSLAAAPGFKYIWSNGDTTQTIIVKNAGDYSVRIINEKCFSDPSPVLSVTVNPIPQPLGIVAGGPTFFCLGDSVILTADSSQGYIWSNGATTRSISVKRGGDYSVQAVVNGCISPASQTVNVTVTPPEQPEIVASGPVNICAGDSVVLSAPTGFMYLWSNNAVSETITVRSSGTFTVSTIASGCTSTVSNPVTVNVTPIPNPVSISAGGPTGFCLGDSVILTAGPSSGYLWSNGATTQSIAVKRGGSYTVRAVNNNCFSDSSNSIRVMVSPPEVPEITPLGATDFCSGDSVFLTAPAGLEYIWSTNEITQTIKVKSSGFYTVRTILNNCTSTVSPALQINVVQQPNQPTITADGPVSFCQGESVKLNASPGTAHLWSTGETGAFIEVNQPGKYYVQTLNGFCVSPKSDSIIVIVRDTSRTITGANVCQGTVIPFGNTLITSSGIYTQVLTNAFGCDSTIVFDALVHPKPSTGIRFLSNGSVRAVAQGPQYSYIWINNMGSIISTTDSLNRPYPAFYTLIVIDSTFGLGCADTTTFFVRSINKSLTSSLKVYPNPADNLIKVEGLPEDSQLYFYTPLGVKIPAEINLEGQINTRDLPAGVYFLVVNSRTETQTIKVSIKH